MVKLKSLPELGDRIKYIRTMMDVSQAELAEKIGTTQQAIQQAEAGLARRPRYLYELARLADVPFEWLAMNDMPENYLGNSHGFAERDEEVLGSFYGMPKEDQNLMLELMKSRNKKKS